MKIRNILFGILLVLPFTALADEIEDQIKLGLEVYQSNDYEDSIEELNYAIAQIREKLNSQQAVLLPNPLKEWSASKVENISGAMAMMGGGTQLSRSYQRESEEIEITIMANSPMVSGALMMVNNPMLIGSNPDMKPYRYNRMKGIQEISESNIEITLAVSGQIMVQISGRNTDISSVEQYLKATDFDKINSSLSQ